jgi:hypothetical protein
MEHDEKNVRMRRNHPFLSSSITASTTTPKQIQNTRDKKKGKDKESTTATSTNSLPFQS